eukprot:UN07714
MANVWICPNCQLVNFAWRKNCQACFITHPPPSPQDIMNGIHALTNGMNAVTNRVTILFNGMNTVITRMNAFTSCTCMPNAPP